MCVVMYALNILDLIWHMYYTFPALLHCAHPSATSLHIIKRCILCVVFYTCRQNLYFNSQQVIHTFLDSEFSTFTYVFVLRWCVRVLVLSYTHSYTHTLMHTHTHTHRHITHTDTYTHTHLHMQPTLFFTIHEVNTILVFDRSSHITFWTVSFHIYV